MIARIRQEDFRHDGVRAPEDEFFVKEIASEDVKEEAK